MGTAEVSRANSLHLLVAGMAAQFWSGFSKGAIGRRSNF